MVDQLDPTYIVILEFVFKFKIWLCISSRSNKHYVVFDLDFYFRHWTMDNGIFERNQSYSNKM